MIFYKIENKNDVKIVINYNLLIIKSIVILNHQHELKEEQKSEVNDLTMEEEFKFAVTIKKKSYFNNINEIDQMIALTFQCHYKDPVERTLTFLNESSDPRIEIS